MLIMLNAAINLVFIGCMIFSLVIIIASIGWIRDLCKLKKNKL